ncbi:unnamed protein product [Brassicogethes aeneus]|uniref:Uncharacterized protein n=1 Tax=Brassicogethes aeneus TaxID=1431903 RepID=A0A9P0AWM1_BRAAE|nr:unnamed protein product [Brassicogethes aeneus]
MYHTLQFLHQREKMLKSINNNAANAFSMESLLSSGKISPENLEIITDKTAENLEDGMEDSFEAKRDVKTSMSPNENTRSENENDRLSPEKNDVFLPFNNCFKDRICSNCGRYNCNFFSCRFSDSAHLIKESKPVLKFSCTIIMYHTLQFLHQREKMLKSINNNATNAFSMESLLSSGKISPENLEIITDKTADNLEDGMEDSFEAKRDVKTSMSPNENTRSENENDRLSPGKNDVFLPFNNCFKDRICSNCGRYNCNFFSCRFSDSAHLIKESKPVLKFSVSAILGNEKKEQRSNSQTGK